MEPRDVARHLDSLAGVRRKGSRSRPAWYVRDRLVARLEDPETLVVRSGFDEREDLVERHPETFSVPPRMEGHRKVEADLRRGDPQAVRDALTAAWELQRR